MIGNSRKIGAKSRIWIANVLLGKRQMGIYQGLSEYKPDVQASASFLAYTRLRFGLVLVRNYLPLALWFTFSFSVGALAQDSLPQSVILPQKTNAVSNATQRSIVRDPRTGRWYQQEIRTVDQPVVRWEWKHIDQIVYRPQVVTELQPVSETVYVPQTRYVLTYKPKGTWNPLRTPVAAYEYVPQTTWVPQTRVSNRPVTTPKWVAKQEKVAVPQLVQSTVKAQQRAQTEIPAPALISAASSPAPISLPNTLGLAVRTRQPLFSVPILGRHQSSNPPTPLGQVASTSLILPPAFLPGSSQRNYSAPLTTSTPVSQTAFRESWQVGLPPTVVR